MNGFSGIFHRYLWIAPFSKTCHVRIRARQVDNILGNGWVLLYQALADGGRLLVCCQRLSGLTGYEGPCTVAPCCFGSPPSRLGSLRSSGFHGPQVAE